MMCVVFVVVRVYAVCCRESVCCVCCVLCSECMLCVVVRVYAVVVRLYAVCVVFVCVSVTSFTPFLFASQSSSHLCFSCMTVCLFVCVCVLCRAGIIHSDVLICASVA
jgi:hypothetical protein